MTHATKFRRKVKSALVKSLGGACNRCGYCICEQALDLHHLDESSKQFGFGSGIRSCSQYLEEARKCILLCANCHRELHAGIWNTSDITVQHINENVFWDEVKGLKLRKPNICPVCNDKPCKAYKKTCGEECSRIFRRKVDRPNKEELQRLLLTHSKVAIASMYGVSETAVRKWIKHAVN